MNIDSELRLFMESLARQAGQVAAALSHRVTPRRKSDGTLVTAADEASGRLIGAWLHHHFPSHAVLSEEESTDYDSSQPYTWVVDPLDGTTNFARGLPVWGVCIALLEKGQPVAAVSFFPLLHEMYSALRGQGAFRNGVPLQRRADASVDDQHLLALCSRSQRRFVLNTPLKRRMLGSAAYHILSVAMGATLAALESTPKVWDLAAAHLVLTEAGGVIAHLDGSPIFPLPDVSRDYANVARPVLAAVNAEVFRRIRASITPRAEPAGAGKGPARAS